MTLKKPAKLPKVAILVLLDYVGFLNVGIQKVGYFPVAILVLLDYVGFLDEMSNGDMINYGSQSLFYWIM